MSGDLMEFLRLGLPVLWLLVATGVAMLLYKTSEALFEEERRGEAATRRIRLVGSATIAAFAFVGLMYATKAVERPTGSKIVTAETIGDLRVRRTRAVQAVAELERCLDLAGMAAECRAEVQDLSRGVEDLAAMMEAKL